MLNADGVAIRCASVPSLVSFKHHLGNLTVSGTDDIMRRDLRIAILEPADAARVTSFCIMDYYGTHLFGTRFPVAFGCRIPNGRRVVGTACNTQFRCGEQVVILAKNQFQVNVVFLKTILLSLFGIIQESTHRIQHALHGINVLLLSYRQLRKLLDHGQIVFGFGGFALFSQQIESLGVCQHILFGTLQNFRFRNARQF